MDVLAQVCLALCSTMLLEIQPKSPGLVWLMLMLVICNALDPISAAHGAVKNRSVS